MRWEFVLKFLDKPTQRENDFARQNFFLENPLENQLVCP